MARPHVLQRTQRVALPRGAVFAFFADAHNLEVITPSFLRFRIVTPGAIVIAAGALIDYRLSLFGVPFSWRTRIESYDPGREFVDVQLSGPYRRWRHVHAFEDADGGGTLVHDRVEYELPLGPLGEVAHALVVSRALRAIFDHRRARIEALLAPEARVTPPAGAP